jgi:transcriptional regulator GlxA family with amidase domain
MAKITFIAYEKCMFSAISGLVDAFSISNSWHQQYRGDIACSLSSAPLFEMEIVSVKGGSVSANGSIKIQSDLAMEAVGYTDLILIPPHLCGIEPDIEEISSIAPWIVRQYKNNVRIGAICTGVSILARTGLLDNKIATTNWQIIDRFKRQFPKVILKPERILTEDSGLICSGAITAQYNLALYVIELFGSEHLARECAKVFLVDPNRNVQTPYMITSFRKNHGDREILRTQTWMEKHYKEDFTTDLVASLAGLSPRHFIRRFKKATGENPLNYLQQLRLETAKNKLETTSDNIDDITQTIGYKDSRTFRRLFKKYTSLSPREYRDKFSVVCSIQHHGFIR